MSQIIENEFVDWDGVSTVVQFSVARRSRPAPQCDGSRVSAMRIYTVRSVAHPDVIGRGINLSKAEDVAFDAYAREVLGWE